MSLHYDLLKINAEDLERVRTMRLDHRLPRGVLVDATSPPCTGRIVACPMDTGAAELIRREIPAVSLSADGLYRIRL